MLHSEADSQAQEKQQDYFEKQRTADVTITDAYCSVNVAPKVEKVREKFTEKVAAEQ